jgi:4-amino-4-deoxy-L-arabinose transferase-like glycosyltransferase
MSGERFLPVKVQLNVKRTLVVALLVGAVVALLVALRTGRDAALASGDERHFLAGAANLALHGRLGFGDPADARSVQALLREPLYPVAIAAVWKLRGTPPPASWTEIDAVPTRRDLYLPIRILHLIALAVAAGAAGWAVARLEGPGPGALAAALVAASPALARFGTEVMSENLTAAALATFAAGLVALRTGRERLGAALLLAVAAPLPLLRAETVLLLPLAAFAIASAHDLIAPRAPRLPRNAVARFALALVVLALPSFGWALRNGAATGHYVLSDRGGLALSVRAALDADVDEFGARTAALAFTPWDRARAKAREIDPEATFSDYRPTGSNNFLLRTYRRFEVERAREGGDFVAVDRRLGREALAEFADDPALHAVTSIVVAWRGLFAEISPEWTHPFDLALPIGLLLGFAGLAVTLFALHERDGARLLFVAPALVLGAFHVAATEFLPRYTLPLLPTLWASVVLLGSRLRREHAGRRARPGTPAPESPPT